MAATIEGAFLLIDRASSTMAKMERQAKKTMLAIEGVGAAQDKMSKKTGASSGVAAANEKQSRTLKAMEAETRRAQRAMLDLGKEHDRFTTRSTVLSKGIDRVRASVRSLHQEYARAMKPLRDYTVALARASSHSAVGSAVGRVDRAIVGTVGAAASKVKQAVGDVGDLASTATAARELGRAGEGAGAAFKGLGGALGALKIPAMAVLFAQASSAVMALGGGLVALIPKLIDVAGAMNALPGAVSVGAQALLTFKAAMHGIAQAVQVGMQAQNQWSTNQREWSQQVVMAQNAVADAVHGVSEAVYAQGVAQHSLGEALYSQTQAQISLTVARRQAIRTLQDMEYAASSAILKEARAGLDIQQAKLQLQQAMATPGTTSLQLESDRLAVFEAQSNAQQTHTQAVRARVDFQRAATKDPTAAPVRAVADAQHALATAVYGVAQAQHAVAQSAYDVGRAQRAVASAQFALNTLLIQGNSGVSAYKKALSGLQPIQQMFVKFLVGKMGPGDPTSLMGHLQKLQEMAGRGLFPGLIRGVQGMSAAWGPMGRVMQATGKVMGDTVSRIMDVFTKKKGMGEMEHVGMNNVKVMGNLGDAFVSIAHTVRTMMVAAQPFLLWLSEVVKHMAALHDKSTTVDGLTKKFDRAKSALKLMFDILRNVWHMFGNVMHAARPLGDVLWKGADRATKKWAEWTKTHGPAMTQWFNGLLPTLQAFGHLLGAIAKAFVQMGNAQGQKGASSTLNALTGAIPAITGFLQAISALSPALVAIFKVTVTILAAIGKVVTFLTQIPGIGKGIAVALGVAFAASIVLRFVSRLTGLKISIGSIAKKWWEVHKAKRAALGGPTGMPSPGTTGGGGAASRVTWWGIRSRTGPGSEGNPLVVVMMGGGRLPGGGGTSNTGKLGKGASTVERDAALAKDAAAAEKIGAAGSTAARDVGMVAKAGEVGILARGAGALGKFGGAATGAFAKVSGVGASVLGKLGPVGGLLGKAGTLLGHAALPLAALTTAIPAILSFFNTKGSFGTKAQAGGNAAVSSLTFGLVPHLFGVGAAAQRAQGTARADKSWSKFGTDPSTGLLTDKGAAAAKGRLEQLRGQITILQHPPPVVGIRGQSIPGVPDIAVIIERQAQVKKLQATFDAEQVAHADHSASQWQSAYAAAIARGMKPKQAMTQEIAGLKGEMSKLNPAGKLELAKASVAWAAQMAHDNPAMVGQMQALNRAITDQFRAMGQNVQIVNGQILTGSADEWNKIGTAITDPATRALNKLNGTWGLMEAQAIGSLQAMGYTKADAGALFKSVVSGQVTVSQAGTTAKYGPTGVTGVAPLKAKGGRVAGNNPRDVYQMGNNMVGGGELVVNRHQEAKANAALMRAGSPTLGGIVSNTPTPHWAYAKGGRAAGGGVGNIPGASAVGGGYRFPFAGSGWGQSRTDQGVDFYGSGPIGAIGSGKVTYSNPNDGWYGPAPAFMVYSLDSGPRAGSYVYVSEHIGGMAPAGTNVTAGQAVAQLTGPIEMGWAAGPLGHQIPQSMGANHLTQAGQDFAAFLGGLAHGSITGGAGGSGASSTATAAAVQQIPPLKANPISGVGGVPKVVAQTAADMIALGMTGFVNKQLAAMAPAGGVPGSPNYSGVPTGSAGGSNIAANKALGHQMMLAGGWPESEWPSLLALWMGESGWDANVMNNPSLGWLGTHNASGIPQADDHGQVYKQGDARGQIAWGLNYIRGSYGSPSHAYSQWQGRNPHWYESGGRVPADGGWMARGGTFTTNGPTVFGAGERGKERVTVEPAGSHTGGPVQITIHKIEVHRKGDVQKIVDEELALLAHSLRGGL